MALTPEEKKRINEEEKLRYEAQKRLKAEDKAKRQQRGCLGCLVILAAIFLPVLVAHYTKPTNHGVMPAPRPTNESEQKLNSSIGYDTEKNQVLITNLDNFDWNNIIMKLNWDFKLAVPKIKAKASYAVGSMQFAKDDGSRFNPFQVKPASFWIAADTPQGRKYSEAGWQ